MKKNKHLNKFRNQSSVHVPKKLEWAWNLWGNTLSKAPMYMSMEEPTFGWAGVSTRKVNQSVADAAVRSFIICLYIVETLHWLHVLSEPAHDIIDQKSFIDGICEQTEGWNHWWTNTAKIFSSCLCSRESYRADGGDVKPTWEYKWGSSLPETTQSSAFMFRAEEHVSFSHWLTLQQLCHSNVIVLQLTFS